MFDEDCSRFTGDSVDGSFVDARHNLRLLGEVQFQQGFCLGDILYHRRSRQLVTFASETNWNTPLGVTYSVLWRRLQRQAGFF
eukprot:15453_4